MTNKHIPMDFDTRCRHSSPAWGRLDRAEMRAVAMITSGRILTASAWRGLDSRLEAHAVHLRSSCTVPSGHGRVWLDGMAVRTYRRLRSLQQQAQALAQVAILLADPGIN